MRCHQWNSPRRPALARSARTMRCFPDFSNGAIAASLAWVYNDADRIATDMLIACPATLRRVWKKTVLAVNAVWSRWCSLSSLSCAIGN